MPGSITGHYAASFLPSLLPSDCRRIKPRRNPNPRCRCCASWRPPWALPLNARPWSALPTPCGPTYEYQRLLRRYKLLAIRKRKTLLQSKLLPFRGGCRISAAHPLCLALSHEAKYGFTSVLGHVASTEKNIEAGNTT